MSHGLVTYYEGSPYWDTQIKAFLSLCILGRRYGPPRTETVRAVSDVTKQTHALREAAYKPRNCVWVRTFWTNDAGKYDITSDEHVYSKTNTNPASRSASTSLM